MSGLTKQAIDKLDQYLAAVAADSGMAYTPSSGLSTLPVPVKTHERLVNLVVDQDHTGFLKKINIVSGLHETEGVLLYGDLDEHVLKRTDTPNQLREHSVASRLQPHQAAQCFGLPSAGTRGHGAPDGPGRACTADVHPLRD